MRLKRWFNIFFFIILVSLITASVIIADRLPQKFPFNEENALEEWQEKIFRGRVFYSIKVNKRDGYLSAYSDDSASGIFYDIKFDPKEFPMMSWQWKVMKFPVISKLAHEGGDWIEKDDYAARIYVIFPRLSFYLTKCLQYIWDKELPVDTVMTSPYSDNIKLIVAESGRKNIGKWVYEERNIYEDYKKAFGREPGRVGAIAIMTDTDNTQSTAEAHYKELKVGYRNEP
jgi:hypothetical protein